MKFVSISAWLLFSLLVLGLLGCDSRDALPNEAWSYLRSSSTDWEVAYATKTRDPGGWTKVAGGSYGFTDDTIWLHRDVDSLPSGEWVVDLSWVMIDKAELFLVDGNGRLVQQIRGGSGIPYSEKKLPSKTVALPFEILSSEIETQEKHLFLALRSTSIVFANPLVLSAQDYRSVVEEKTLIDAIFFSSVLALLIIIFILGILTKDRILLLFLVSQGFSGLWLLGFSGLGYAYLWPDLPSIHPGALYTLNGSFLSLYIISVSFFFQRFLELEKKNYRVEQAFSFLRWVVGIATPLWFCQPFWPLVHSAFMWFGAGLAILLMAVLVREFLRGSKRAKLLLVGGLWSALTFLAVVESAVVGDAQSLLPLLNGIYVAHFIFGVTIAVSIAFEINRERLERWQAQKEALRVAENARLNLQSEVDRQTRELMLQTDELQKTVADLKEAQETIEQQAREAAVGHVVAGFAHEVRNPLNFILGGATAIADWREELDDEVGGGKPLPQEGLKHLLRCTQIVLNGSNRIQELLDKLGAFVTETASSDLEPCSVALSLEAVFEELEVDFPAIRKAVLVSFSGHCWVRASSTGMETILSHLLRNALEATGGAGPVKLVCEGTDTEVFVSVEDGGVGVPVENETDIFDAFFTTKEELCAVGLGLAVSSVLARNFSGELVLANNATVAGVTEFVLRLPALAPQTP